MTIEEAVNLLTVKHLENKVKKWIRDPVAYTLHEVWRIADSKATYHPSNLQQTCNHVATHGDELRAMSDEELAQEIANLVDHPWCSEGGCIIKQDGKCGWPETGCDESALEWLRSPADGGDGDG